MPNAVFLKWAKYYPLAIGFASIFPMFYSSQILLGTSRYTYIPSSDNYVTDFTASHSFIWISTISILVVCNVASIILNAAVIFSFCSGHLQLHNGNKNTEMKLFLNSFAEVLSAIVVTIVLIIQCDASSDMHSRVFNLSRNYILYAGDFQCLHPPFVLLLTSETLRRAITRMLGRKSVNQIT